MTLSGLGVNAQNSLWAVFFIQGAAAIIYGVAGFKLPAEKRDHFSAHHLSFLCPDHILGAAKGVFTSIDSPDTLLCFVPLAASSKQARAASQGASAGVRVQPCSSNLNPELNQCCLWQTFLQCLLAALGAFAATACGLKLFWSVLRGRPACAWHACGLITPCVLAAVVTTMIVATAALSYYAMVSTPALSVTVVVSRPFVADILLKLI